MKKSISILLVVLFGVIVSAITLGILFDKSQSAEITLADEVKIGLILPLTGDLSTHGEEGNIAAKLAVSNFNKYLQEIGEPLTLKLVSEDTGTNQVMALDKLTSLHAKGIKIVVGPESSAELRLIKEYADSNGIVLISPSSTAPSLAIPDDYIFRLLPDDTKQGPALAKLIDHSSIKVLVPVWRSDTWGDGLHDTVSDSFTERGGIVDEGIRYNPESPEFSASTSLLAEKVQRYVDEYGADNVGILIISFAEVLQIMQSAAGHDILDDVRWFGADGNTKEQRLIEDSIGLKFSNDVAFTTTQVASNDNVIRQAVSDHIEERLGRTPNSYAYSAYDAVYIAGLSILQTQNTDDMIKDVILKVAESHSGAIGSTKLNAAGDLEQADYEVWGIRDGQWALLGKYTQSDDSITLIKIGLYDSTTDSISEISSKIEHDVKNAVQQTIAQYDGDLESITNLQHGKYYSFVLNEDLSKILAHPIKEKIGTEPFLDIDVNMSLAEIIQMLNTTDDGVWIEYMYLNPADGKVENKRSWLVFYDGYVFGAGYYNP